MQTGADILVWELGTGPLDSVGLYFICIIGCSIWKRKWKFTFLGTPSCGSWVLYSVPETHLGPLLWSTDDVPGDQWKPLGGPKRCRRRLRFLQECAEKGRKSHSRPSSTKLERLSFKEGHVVNRRLRLTEQSSEVFTVTLRNLSLWQLQTRMSPSGRRITIVFALREKNKTI